MNSLEAFKLNHQIIYLNQENAVSFSINLLHFGYELFRSTYKSQNIQKLEQLSKLISEGEQPEYDDFIDFTKNNLIDNIKIIICFENFFKALFLSNMQVINILDSNIFPELSKEQRKRPIAFDEILGIFDWSKIVIESSNEENQTSFYKIKGISDRTISFSTILNQQKYYEDLNVESSILNILRKLYNDRNKLHLNFSLSSDFTINSYKEFDLLDKFLKTNIPPNLNKMFDFLGLSEDNRIPKAMIKKKSP